VDCSLRWNCSTETLRNNWWFLVFLLRPAAVLRSLLLITLSNTVGRTIPLRWHVSFCHDLSLIRIYTYSNTPASLLPIRNTCTLGVPERTSSTDRELQRELAETDRNSNVRIVQNYFPRRTMRHVDGAHEIEINQEDSTSVS